MNKSEHPEKQSNPLESCDVSSSRSRQGVVYENIQELSARTKLPVTWWYNQTRKTGPGSVPRLKTGKYLLFIPGCVDAWLSSKGFCSETL